MCGFAAIHGKAAAPVQRDRITGALKAIAHRGPDGEGVSPTPQGAILHRRLAIRDVSHGAQPMWDNTGRYCLAYNGEIYNHEALTQQLRQRHAVSFQTHCDTELLLLGLIHEGVNFLHQINGMFAFCFYDGNSGTLLIARDRYGIKPLFYGAAGGVVAVGSEINAVLALQPSLSTGWDHVALDHYFTLGYIPPPRTHLSQVKHIAPGEAVTIDAQGAMQSIQFCDIAKHIHRNGAPLSDEDGRAMLSHAVQSQCVSDVPVGTFLSGGVDSSIVTRIAAEHIAPPVHMFTAGFREQAYNEAGRAGILASQLQGQHHTVWVDDSSMRKYGAVGSMFNTPFSDNAAYPTYMVSKKAAEHVKVVLSGDGADELFYGYRNHRSIHFETQLKNRIPGGIRRHLIANLARFYPNHPSMPRYLRARSTLTALSQGLAQSYCWAMSQMTPERLNRMYTPAFKSRVDGQRADDLFLKLVESANCDDPMKVVQHLDFSTYLPGCILTKLDRASMHAGVEARVPFLDNTLVTTLLGQPHERNMDSVLHKRMLRRWCRDLLPEETSMRVKKSFTSPLDEWFRQLQKPLFYGTLLSDALLDSGFFDPNALVKTLDDHYEGRANDGPFLWSLAIFNRFIAHHDGEELAR